MHDQLLIHIGYNKTGTTWRQTRLFQNRDVGFARIANSGEVIKEFILPDASTFDEERCRHLFIPRLRAAADQGLMPVLSAGLLSGKSRDSKEPKAVTAQRLVRVFPQARILIVIREQKSMLLSMYKQKVKGISPQTIQQFLQPASSNSHATDEPASVLDHLCYDWLIALYMDLFGQERVLVLPYELFGEQPFEFVRRLVQFCEMEVAEASIQALPVQERLNVSPSAGSLEVKRYLNRLISHPALKKLRSSLKRHPMHRAALNAISQINKWMPNHLRETDGGELEAVIAAATEGYYAESNQRTRKLTGLALEQYGYQLPPLVATPREG